MYSVCSNKRARSSCGCWLMWCHYLKLLHNASVAIKLSQLSCNMFFDMFPFAILGQHFSSPVKDYTDPDLMSVGHSNDQMETSLYNVQQHDKMLIKSQHCMSTV